MPSSRATWAQLIPGLAGLFNCTLLELRAELSSLQHKHSFCPLSGFFEVSGRKRGRTRRDTDEIRIDRIESIDIKQSIVGRIFGFGTIYVTGTGAKIIALEAVTDVIEIRKALVSLSDEVRG